MLTATEQAKAYALQTAGLRWENRDRWSDADRRAYLAANAEFRQRNPALFTPAEQAAAANYASAGAQGPIEFSYVKEFIKEGTAQAWEFGQSVASVGEGIKNGLNLTRYLIPAALIIAAGIGLVALAKKSGAAAPRSSS